MKDITKYNNFDVLTFETIHAKMQHYYRNVHVSKKAFEKRAFLCSLYFYVENVSCFFNPFVDVLEQIGSEEYELHRVLTKRVYPFVASFLYIHKERVQCREYSSQRCDVLRFVNWERAAQARRTDQRTLHRMSNHRLYAV